MKRKTGDREWGRGKGGRGRGEEQSTVPTETFVLKYSPKKHITRTGNV